MPRGVYDRTEYHKRRIAEGKFAKRLANPPPEGWQARDERIKQRISEGVKRVWQRKRELGY